MRLRAVVKESKGNVIHSTGELIQGNPVANAILPTPAWVEIHQVDGAFSLIHFDGQGNSFADTWHQTLTEAKEQAQFEFNISFLDWTSLES